jgi:hypothetical protein
MTDARIPLFLVFGLLSVGSAHAQNPPDAPAAPDNTDSAMYSLEDLYDRLDTGAAGSDPSTPPNTTRAFGEPTTGPTGATMKNLNEIMVLMPEVDDSNGAAVGNVLQGKTFWGLTSSGWGLKTGTLDQQTPTANSVSQAAGIYDAFDLSVVDPDLAAGNIRAGVSLFGVSGDNNVVDTSSGDAIAADMLSGKTAWVDGAELTGTMPNNGAGSTITPGTTNQTLAAGYWSSANTVAGDSDLTSDNIKSGTTIFAVSGNSNVVDTAEATNPVVATRLKTGDVAFVNGNKITGSGTQTLSDSSATVSEGYYAATTLTTVDDDLAAGNIKSGTTIFGVTGTYETPPCNCDSGTIWDSANGGTRWCDNADGTVTDLAEDLVSRPNPGLCLVWLKDARCSDPLLTITPSSATDFSSFEMYTLDWIQAIQWTLELHGGTVSPTCGLSDGSSRGAWRVPTSAELRALTMDPERIRSDSMGPFLNVPDAYVWSSSSSEIDTAEALFLRNAGGQFAKKTFQRPVWPVRGGQ